MGKFNAVTCLLAVALTNVSACAWANDSSAQIGIGGLTLIRNEVVRLDSEELTIARDKVE
jgi:hypothetical protein